MLSMQFQAYNIHPTQDSISSLTLQPEFSSWFQKCPNDQSVGTFSVPHTKKNIKENTISPCENKTRLGGKFLEEKRAAAI